VLQGCHSELSPGLCSRLSRLQTIPWDDLQGQQRYDPSFAYGLSKLLNLLFTAELARRLAGTGVTANSVHPGFLRTDLARAAEGVWRLVRAVVRHSNPVRNGAPRSWSTRQKGKMNLSTKQIHVSNSSGLSNPGSMYARPRHD
jgi:NAD(P)-dependent dehydrogenase (short-subunit alcohol dehydrogenase family)